MRKTTTLEILQAEKHSWQNCFLTKNAAVRKNFLCDTSPFHNYLAFVSIKNNLA